jgi:hypothetical protein
VNQIKVTKITETRILDNRGQPIAGISVTYTVGDHGPFSESGTKEEFLTGTIRTRMDAVARAVNTQAPGM